MKSPNLSELTAMEKKLLISPVIRSRGARLLHLVKNNKLNVSPQLNKRLSMSQNVMNNLMERNEKKRENNEYLIFSNGTPNLNSSPSSSILSKRKSTIETPDSPSSQNSAKRKRVSFNDPVSTTKEYLITEEEERSKSNSLIRCLTYENDENNEQEGFEECENKVSLVTPVDEEKHNTKEEINIQDEEEEEQKMIKEIKIEDENIDIVTMDHDYDENPQHTDITTSSNEFFEIEQTSNENKLIFKDKDELMDYVMENFTFNEIFDKLYNQNNVSVEESHKKRKEFIGNVLDKVDVNDVLNELLPMQDPTKHSKMTPEQLEKTSNLINHLSKMMKMNDRIKHKFLDTLSEKHSKDFLSHALQENSVATVCQKLTIPSIVNYLIHKVNVCDEDETDFEINRLHRSMIYYLIKKTGSTHESITDQKEVQELLKLLFKNMKKIEVLDSVHEFLRSNIIQGSY